MTSTTTGSARRVHLRGSTIALIVAMLAMLAGYRSTPLSTRVPTQIAVWIVYVVWPVAAGIGGIWSAWDIARSSRQQRLQFVLQLAAAIALLIAYYIAITSPS